MKCELNNIGRTLCFRACVACMPCITNTCVLNTIPILASHTARMCAGKLIIRVLIRVRLLLFLLYVGLSLLRLGQKRHKSLYLPKKAIRRPISLICVTATSDHCVLIVVTYNSHSN